MRAAALQLLLACMQPPSGQEGLGLSDSSKHEAARSLSAHWEGSDGQAKPGSIAASAQGREADGELEAPQPGWAGRQQLVLNSSVLMDSLIVGIQVCIRYFSACCEALIEPI